MKILLVTEASSAGVGRHVIDLGQGLARRGWDVHLAYADTRIDVRFRTALSDPHFTCHHVPMKRAPSPSDFLAIKRLRSILQMHGPFNILHGHSSKGGAIARLASLGLRVPVVYTPHAFVTMNPALKKPAAFAFLTAERLMARKTDAIVAVSRDEKVEMERHGISGANIHVIHNGIVTPAFGKKEYVRKQFGIKSDSTVIGFVGRFFPQKAPLMLVEAFSIVARSQTNVTLLMAGDGPLLREAKCLAEKLGILEKVRFVGSVSAESVLPAMDVFALPSLYEAMPYVLIEAVHAKLPIVTTDVGSASILIQDGKSGFIVRSRSAEDFAASLDRLVADEKTRLRFRDATERQIAEFSEENMMSETISLYQSLQPDRGVCRLESSDKTTQETASLNA